WDRSVGGGVPVEQSREMYRLTKAKGFDVRYTEVPKHGHSAPQEVFEQVVNWLIEQKKQRQPRHVSLVTYELRHNRNYWVSVDQLSRSGRRASIDANFAAGSLVVKTDNVLAFSVGPIADASSAVVRVDGQSFPSRELGKTQSFHRSAKGAWIEVAAEARGQKHHGASGPMSDIFFDDVILVPGTAGSEAETFFNAGMANNVKNLFKAENGGLHRGGIRGPNTIDPPLPKDNQLE